MAMNIIGVLWGKIINDQIFDLDEIDVNKLIVSIAAENASDL